MAWEEIRPIMVGKRSMHPAVSIAWRQHGKGEKGHRLFISINGPLMKTLGWKKGTHLSVKVNHHAKLIKLTATSATGFALQTKHTSTGYVAIRLDGVQITGTKTATATGFHLEDKSIVAQMPKWAVREGADYGSHPALTAPLSAPAPRQSIMDRVGDPDAKLRARMASAR